MPTKAADRPNILLIMSDEHDPAVTGIYDDAVVETPNLDRLGREGVVFDACYTNSPLCVPARLSLTAGKYVSRCGAWSNASRLPSEDCSSIASVLRSVGYETYLCGKQHYDPARRYGFTDILPEISSNRCAKTGRGGRRRPDDSTPDAASWRSRSGEFHTAEDSSIMRHDRRVTRRACEFLAGCRADRPPFFLFVGHLAPHFPLIAPQEIYRKYRGRVPMPEIPDGLIESLPRNYQQLRYGFGVQDAEADDVRKGREFYWALVDWYDRQIGQVLDALAGSPAAENTVVLYTSDHGENKGDHGLWWKNNLYDHAARIPLIARWPGRWNAGERRGGACSLVDLVQTIVELAGAEAPDDWDGDSMLRWLQDEQSPWKDMAVSEYYGHNIASGMAMIRRGPWKYIYHTRADERFGPQRELFCLETDPKELCNLAEAPAQAPRIRQMHEALVEQLGREPDEAEQQCRREQTRGYRGP